MSNCESVNDLQSVNFSSRDNALDHRTSPMVHFSAPKMRGNGFPSPSCNSILLTYNVPEPELLVRELTGNSLETSV